MTETHSCHPQILGRFGASDIQSVLVAQPSLCVFEPSYPIGRSRLRAVKTPTAMAAHALKARISHIQAVYASRQRSVHIGGAHA
eukprot:678467-Pleurochrysis_carterae.AAC.5